MPITASEAVTPDTRRGTHTSTPGRITELVQRCTTLHGSLWCHSNSALLQDALVYIAQVLLKFGEKKTSNLTLKTVLTSSEWNEMLRLTLEFLYGGSSEELKLKGNEPNWNPHQDRCSHCTPVGHFLWPWKGKLHLSCRGGGSVWSWLSPRLEVAAGAEGHLEIPLRGERAGDPQWLDIQRGNQEQHWLNEVSRIETAKPWLK